MAIIEVQQVSKSYAGRSALSDVTLSVDAGEIFGIMGPNGAGKTTLVEVIEGLRTPDAGSVRVLGMNPRTERRRLNESLGVQLQHTELPANLKVAEALKLYASFYRSPADWPAVMSTWGLSELAGRRIGKLSGGQKQRLFIALALVGDPELVVLDELTTGLDPSARRETLSLVRRVRDGGVTVVLISHFMGEIEALCDRVAVLNRGTIVAVDTPAALAERVAERTLDEAFEKLTGGVGE
ncbi:MULTISPECIES: ABC transporter ATP-binding protein [Microbacterium]|uniref:ABC transporter ATP-binding protein n=1 Tax=Microbacterium TaxID=33882 RepID=UPI000D65088B|nr:MULTISPECIES: ABC transporter ATP-binding protein [Microbacterium]